MPKGNVELALQQQIEVITDFKIDKGDIVAVAISDAETALIETKDTLQKRVNELSRQVKDIEDKIPRLETKACDEHARGRFEKTIEYLKAIYPKISFDDMNVYQGSTNRKTNKLTYDVIIKYRIKPKSKQNGHTRSIEIEDGGEIAVPKEATSLREERDDLTKEHDSLIEKLYDIRVALGDMDRIERRARAAIVKATLSGELQYPSDILKAVREAGKTERLVELIGEK